MPRVTNCSAITSTPPNRTCCSNTQFLCEKCAEAAKQSSVLNVKGTGGEPLVPGTVTFGNEDSITTNVETTGSSPLVPGRINW